ncbi:CvpA family protein [Dysgonomonas sp. 25]|nr:CvpA family protein [Dysgonomonas sp. 25]
MNWFDIFVLILLAATLIRGYITGLVMQVAMLAGIILGAIFSGWLADFIAPYLMEWTGAAPHIIGPLSYIVAFLLILLVLFLVGRMIHSTVKAAHLNFPNRVAGAVFCAVKWFLVLSVLVSVIEEFDQNKSIFTEEVREQSYTYPIVKAVAPTIIPYLRFDWFEQLPQAVHQEPSLIPA